jgi:hypothetical protein
MEVIHIYGTRKLPVRRSLANISPVRATAESGHGIMIRFSFANPSQRFTGGLYLKTLLIGDPFSKLL